MEWGRSQILTVHFLWTAVTVLDNFDSLAYGKAPSTLICFQTKTELFYSGYFYRPHYNAENDHRKRSPKTEPFENALQSGAI